MNDQNYQFVYHIGYTGQSTMRFIVGLKYRTLKISMISCSYITLFVIHKRGNLTY